jgi:hypothetical protein
VQCDVSISALMSKATVQGILILMDVVAAGETADGPAEGSATALK